MLERAVRKSDLLRISDYIWEIPQDYWVQMRVPARIYADEPLLEAALGDASITQLVNTATLPGVVKYTIAMPDIHQGYGFPIGGVAATRLPDGVISPGGVGYDINCGVRLLASRITADEARPMLRDLAETINTNCPTGVGARGKSRLSQSELEQVLCLGARWAQEHGYAEEADLERTEDQGNVAGADPAQVSVRARERGAPQIGTLGAGNHFIELDRVAAVYDEAAATILGLFFGQTVVQIHCGSRGFGHQVCEDYVRDFQPLLKKYGIELPDRELVCAPLDSPEGQAYCRAMACAANFAFANRQVLTYQIRRTFEKVLAKRAPCDLQQVYDIAHNMAKIEEHQINGSRLRLCVHRKGATRAFGPYTPGLPPDLIELGQPVLIPGSMGTASYVLLGTPGSMNQTFGSTCHGAGRMLSRTKARKIVRGQRLRQELEDRGITVCAGSLPGLAEEAPVAYKDVSQVVETVAQAGIARKVARLEPIAVIKG